MCVTVLQTEKGLFTPKFDQIRTEKLPLFDLYSASKTVLFGHFPVNH